MKTTEAIITNIHFEPRIYNRYRRKGASSDYYKDGVYHCYRSGWYSEYKPAKLLISIDLKGEKIELDISEEIKERFGGSLKKDVVDSIIATLPDKISIYDTNEISEESISKWVEEAKELRRAV